MELFICPWQADKAICGNVTWDRWFRLANGIAYHLWWYCTVSHCTTVRIVCGDSATVLLLCCRECSDNYCVRLSVCPPVCTLQVPNAENNKLIVTSHGCDFWKIYVVRDVTPSSFVTRQTVMSWRNLPPHWKLLRRFYRNVVTCLPTCTASCHRILFCTTYHISRDPMETVVMPGLSSTDRWLVPIRHYNNINVLIQTMYSQP